MPPALQCLRGAFESVLTGSHRRTTYLAAAFGFPLVASRRRTPIDGYGLGPLITDLISRLAELPFTWRSSGPGRAVTRSLSPASRPIG
jgi:hypothetical protein